MSVSFYDPENMTQYDDEYNVIEGGPEANFANTNARMILEILGLETDPSLYGEVSAEDMIAAINRGIVSVNAFCKEENSKTYLLQSFQQIREVAEASMNHSKKVCWG